MGELINDTATQANFAVVKDGALSGCYRPLRFGEGQLYAGWATHRKLAGRITLAITGFSGDGPLVDVDWRLTRNPTHIECA